MAAITDLMEMKKNGVSCLTYGIHVLNQPSIVSPRERYESITIPGRSGSLTQIEDDDIHDNISLSVTCVVDDIEHDRTAEIMKWISGEGQYEFYGHGDGYYKGRLSNQISFDRVVQGNPHKAFTFQFDCQPYFYYNGGDVEQTPTITPQHDIWLAPAYGNIASEPLLKLYGSGTAEVRAADGNIMYVNLDNLPTAPNNYLALDCEARIAYTVNPGGDSMTLSGGRVQGKWLRMPVEQDPQTSALFNHLWIYGSVSQVKITPRWRRK